MSGQTTKKEAARDQERISPKLFERGNVESLCTCRYERFSGINELHHVILVANRIGLPGHHYGSISIGLRTLYSNEKDNCACELLIEA